MASEEKRKADDFEATAGNKDTNTYQEEVEQQQYTNASQNAKGSHIADFLNQYGQSLQSEDHPKTLVDALGSLIPGYKGIKAAFSVAKKAKQTYDFGRSALKDPKKAITDVLGHAAKQAGRVNPVLEPLVKSLPERYTAYEKAQQEAAKQPSVSATQKVKNALTDLAAKHLPGGDTDEGRALYANILNDPANARFHLETAATSHLPQGFNDNLDKARNALVNPGQFLDHPEELINHVPLSEEQAAQLRTAKDLHDALSGREPTEAFKQTLRERGVDPDNLDIHAATATGRQALFDHVLGDDAHPLVKAAAQAYAHVNDPERAQADVENYKTALKNHVIDSIPGGEATKNVATKFLNGERLGQNDIIQAAREHAPEPIKKVIDAVGDGSAESIDALKKAAVKAGQGALGDLAKDQVKKQVTHLASKYVPGVDTPEAQKFLGKVLEDPTNVKSHVMGLLNEHLDPIVRQHLQTAQGIRDGGQQLLTDPNVLKRFLPEATPEQLNYLQTLRDVHTVATTGQVSQNLQDKLTNAGLDEGQQHQLLSKPISQWTPDDLSHLAPEGIDQHPVYKSIAYYAQHANDEQAPAALEAVKQHLVNMYLNEHAPDLPPAVKKLATLGINDAKNPETLINAAKEAVPDRYQPALNLLGKGTAPDLKVLQREVIQKGIDSAPLEANTKYHLKKAYNAVVQPDPNDKYAAVRHLSKAAVSEALPHISDDTTKTLLKHAPDAIDFLPGGKNELTRENIKNRLQQGVGAVRDQFNAEVAGVRGVAAKVGARVRAEYENAKSAFQDARNQFRKPEAEPPEAPGAEQTEAAAERLRRAPSPTFSQFINGEHAAGPNDDDDALENLRKYTETVVGRTPDALQQPPVDAPILPLHFPRREGTPPLVNRGPREAANDDHLNDGPIGFEGHPLDEPETIPVTGAARQAADAEQPPHPFPPGGVNPQVQREAEEQYDPRPDTTGLGVPRVNYEVPEQLPERPPPTYAEYKNFPTNAKRARLELEPLPERPVLRNKIGLAQARPLGDLDPEFNDEGPEPSHERLADIFAHNQQVDLENDAALRKFNADTLAVKGRNAMKQARNGLNDIGDAAASKFGAFKEAVTGKIKGLFGSNAPPPKPGAVELQDLRRPETLQDVADQHALPQEPAVKRRAAAPPPPLPNEAAQDAPQATQAVYQTVGDEAGEGNAQEAGGELDAGGFNGFATQAATNNEAEAANSGGVVKNSYQQNQTTNSTNSTTFSAQQNNSAYEKAEQLGQAVGGSGIGAQQGAEVLGAVLKKSSATPDKPPANNNEGEQEQRPGQEGDGDGNAGDIAADTTADEDAAEAAEVTADTVNAGEQAGVGVGEAIGEAIPGIGALVAAGASAYSLYSALSTHAPTPPPVDVALGSEEDVLPTYQASSNAVTGLELGNQSSNVEMNAPTQSNTLDDEVGEYTG